MRTSERRTNRLNMDDLPRLRWKWKGRLRSDPNLLPKMTSEEAQNEDPREPAKIFTMVHLDDPWRRCDRNRQSPHPFRPSQRLNLGRNPALAGIVLLLGR